MSHRGRKVQGSRPLTSISYAQPARPLTFVDMSQPSLIPTPHFYWPTPHFHWPTLRFYFPYPSPLRARSLTSIGQTSHFYWPDTSLLSARPGGVAPVGTATPISPSLGPFLLADPLVAPGQPILRNESIVWPLVQASSLEEPSPFDT